MNSQYNDEGRMSQVKLNACYLTHFDVLLFTKGDNHHGILGQKERFSITLPPDILDELKRRARRGRCIRSARDSADYQR